MGLCQLLHYVVQSIVIIALKALATVRSGRNVNQEKLCMKLVGYLYT